MLRIGVNRRLLRVGPLVLARGRCTRSTPFLDGARIRVTRAGETVVEQFDAGGLRIRLSLPGGPGHALVPTLDVGWRGLRTPNPQRWPITPRGRLYRRAWKAQLEWRAHGYTDDGTPGVAQVAAHPQQWPFV